MPFDALDGDDWTATAARAGLTILVEYARSGRRNLTYREWDEEIVQRGLGKHVLLIQSGRPAGLVGDACKQYAERHGIVVPPINLMVVNKKDGLPGYGADFYIEEFCLAKLGKSANVAAMTVPQKRSIIEQAQDDILAFDGWEELLHAYGLKSADVVTGKRSVRGHGARRHPDPRGWHRGEESDAHRH